MEPGRFRLDEFDLYKAAREFRKKTYRLVRELPVAEVYCLDRQMRRAAVSVTNNIAEGHGRWHYQENMHFLRIARGSVDELIDDFNVCDDESYGNRELVAELKGMRMRSSFALMAISPICERASREQTVDPFQKATDQPSIDLHPK